MEYAGLDPDPDPEGPEQGHHQYATSLPKEVWDPVGELPKWAYKEELGKIMEGERRRREKEEEEAVREGRGRDRVDFVSASRKEG